MWERAGIGSSGQSAIGEGGGEGSWKGLPDGRVMAVDRIRNIGDEIGGPMMRRLVAYCVEGRTPKEIAGGITNDERCMSHVLEVDLVELARTMGYAA